ncbi:MAG: PASTA domain-containing protein [Nocardioides sp.]
MTVPDVVGLDALGAQRVLRQAGLRAVQTLRGSTTCHTIGEQAPAAGTVVPAGSRVVIAVGADPDGRCLGYQGPGRHHFDVMWRHILLDMMSP